MATVDWSQEKSAESVSAAPVPFATPGQRETENSSAAAATTSFPPSASALVAASVDDDEDHDSDVDHDDDDHDDDEYELELDELVHHGRLLPLEAGADSARRDAPPDPAARRTISWLQ